MPLSLSPSGVVLADGSAFVGIWPPQPRQERKSPARGARSCEKIEDLRHQAPWSIPTRRILFVLLLCASRVAAQTATVSPERPWHFLQERQIESDAENLRNY